MKWIQKPPLGIPVNWSHPLSRGLVGCWLMNEGSGNLTYDLSGRDHAIITGSPEWKDGGIYFADNSDYAITQKPVKLTTQGSMFCFYRTLGTPSNYGFIFSCNTTASNWSLNRENNNLMLTQWYGTKYYIHDFCKNIFDKQIHSVGMSVKDDVSYMYIDGILQNSGGLSGASVPFSETVVIGNRKNLDFSLAGIIYLIYFYNKALTGKQFLNLHREPYSMFDTRPIWMDYSGGRIRHSLLGVYP